MAALPTAWLFAACAGRLVPSSPRRAILTRGAALAATGVLGLEAYMRAPLPLPSSAGDPWDVLERLLPHTRPETLVLVFPGLAGPDANSAAVVDALRRARRRSVVVELDWRPWVGGELRGAVNGRALGSQLGRRLATWASEPATRSSIRNLHLVGISVGSQAADAACSAFADMCSSPHPPHRHLTMLDPFTASGLAGLVVASRAYGVLRFGERRCDPRHALHACLELSPILGFGHMTKLHNASDRRKRTLPASICPIKHGPATLPPFVTGERADYAEAVLNRDDPVPSTSLPLRLAVTYDVTRAAAKERFTPLPGDSLHSWPVAWYAANAKALLARAGPAPTHTGDRMRRRGAVVDVQEEP
jgi:hypothetical protein